MSWAAVSSLPQAQKISLSDQLANNRRHIERWGGVVVEELVVPGESRSIVLFEDAARAIEAFARLKELIDARAFDVLIYLDRSRLGREAALSMAVAGLCRQAGIALYEVESPPATLDPDASHDSLLLGAIKSVGAQAERDKLMRRHEMGMRGRFQRGEFLEGVPWGWRAVFDERGGSHIEIDEDAAALIRLALVDLYVHRAWGMDSIAAELNRRGALTPVAGKPYTSHTVRHLVRMAWRYAGYNEINKSSPRRPYARQKGAWPPILSEDELHAVLAEREARKNARRSVARTYRLSLVCWCAACQRRMSVTSYSLRYERKDGSAGVYDQVQIRCRQPHGDHNYMTVVERKILAELRAEFVRLQDRTTWHAYLDNIQPDQDAIGRQIATHEAAIARAKAAILKTDDHLIDGALDAERHRHQVKRLQARIEAAQHEITVLEERRSTLDHAARRGERLAEIATSGLRMLEHPDTKMANAWLRRHVRVWIENSEVTEIEIL